MWNYPQAALFLAKTSGRETGQFTDSSSMSCANRAFQRITLPLPLQSHRSRPSISSNSGRNGRSPVLPLLQVKPRKLLGNPSFRIRCSVSSDGGMENLVNRLPKFSLGADKVFRLIANATASPICQFVPSPATFLHSVDPRIKLVPFCIPTFIWSQSNQGKIEPWPVY